MTSRNVQSLSASDEACSSAQTNESRQNDQVVQLANSARGEEAEAFYKLRPANKTDHLCQSWQSCQMFMKSKQSKTCEYSGLCSMRVMYGIPSSSSSKVNIERAAFLVSSMLSRLRAVHAAACSHQATDPLSAICRLIMTIANVMQPLDLFILLATSLGQLSCHHVCLMRNSVSVKGNLTVLQRKLQHTDGSTDYNLFCINQFWCRLCQLAMVFRRPPRGPAEAGRNLHATSQLLKLYRQPSNPQQMYCYC